MNPHRASLSRHPLAEIAIAFAVGICAANYFPTRLIVLWIAGGVCAAVVIVALFKQRLAIAGVSLLVAIGVAGMMLAVQERKAGSGNELGEFVGKQVIVTGVLVGPPEFGRDRLYLALSVERLDVDGSSRIGAGVVSLMASFRGDGDEAAFRGLGLRYGARIRVVTMFSRVDNYRNPGVSPLSEYLDRKGYAATGVIKSAASVQRIDDVWVWPPLAWLYSWRAFLQEEIHAKFDSETAGVLDAALLGNRYNLSRETAERFREGGTFHVLVISGMHISLIGGVVFLAIRRLTKRRVLQFVVPAVVVWGYSLAVGAEASVVRAALMFTFAGLAPVLFRQSTSLNGLGAAALVMLVNSPKEIFDPSFQLTFLSVLAIVVVAWPLLQTCSAIGAWYPTRETPAPQVCSRELRWFCELLFWSERKWKKEIARSPYRYRLFKTPLAARLERCHVQVCLRYVFAAVLVSGAVQLLLLPLMIVYFHRLSPSSLVLNIVVGLLLAALTAVALVALVLSQLNLTLAAPVFNLANTIDWLMIHSVDPFAHYNLASIHLPEYSGWSSFVYLLYYVPLLVLVLRITKPQRWVIAQVMLVLVLIVHPFSAVADGNLRVDFLDVGQGDSALVTLPDGRTLLVDGGGTTDRHGGNTDKRSIGAAVVSEYLWWRGLDTVDYVLATHADADHIDGLNDVLRNFTVDAALVARSPANDPEYAKFAQTLSTTKTHVTTIQAGDLIRFGEVQIEVLWPPAATHANEPSRNNDSIVLRVKLAKRSLLLTGDIEKSGENALVGTGKELNADVVKVPHHGSRSSSTLPFVSATKAKFAIVSVGQTSMFGHPHPDVVERWQANGAQVFTTGKCGTITVTTDGTDLILTGMQTHTLQGSPCRAGL
ncbi:MAG TPA: DNA internalization-related competence protein ComEC/Rec2 [Pyrinomonadaceae bacterium]|nr:DNA internalization-related competence protein ComEC/Rec2 [Pyrinomonadaceae bacterium]